MLRDWLMYDNVALLTITITLIFISAWYWYRPYLSRPFMTNTRRTDIVLRSVFNTSPQAMPQHIPLQILLYTIIWLYITHSFLYSAPVNTPFWNYAMYTRTGIFYCIFYISAIITLQLYLPRQKHGGISLQTVTALAFLLLVLSLYFVTSNIIALIFILECQGTALLLFLISNTELLKKTTNWNTYLAQAKEQRSWRINILLLQFWINFFGATTLLLFSLLVLTHIGTLFIADLKLTYLQLFSINTSPLFMGWICFWLLLGILIKSSAFPFHFWKPELYKLLSFPNMFIYAGIYTLLLFILLVYLLKMLYPGWHQYLHVGLWTIAILTIYLITPVFYKITDLRLFLAYSSVFHGLYILVAATASTTFVAYSMAYNIGYFCTTTLIFSVLLLFKHLKFQYLSDFQTLLYNPTIIFWLIAAVASMAGLPPFLGFWTKFGILLSLWANSEFLLMVHLLCCSLIIMYFYFANYRFAGAVNLIRRTHFLQKLNEPSIFIIGNCFAFLNIYSAGLINDLFNYTMLFDLFVHK